MPPCSTSAQSILYCLWIMFKTELFDLSYDWKEIVIVYSAASRADGVLVC